MAIIPQPQLFSWEQVEAISEINRLRLVIEYMPDEPLIQQLEAERKGRRNDYPVRAMWNSIIAGTVFEHRSIQSLRRELARNGELRQMCGFDVFLGDEAVPSAWAYSRFLAKLLHHRATIDKILEELVKSLEHLLPGFGRHLAVDSKAIDSHGKPTKKQQPDGRRDTDADWGIKSYRGTRKDGSLWEKATRWFGYKLHLVVDADYELPLAYQVTRASANDGPHLLPLVEQLDQKHPQLLENTAYLSADKGYDSKENNGLLWDAYAIKPIIDIRNTWREDPELPRSLSPERVDTIFYTEKGQVLCRNRDDQPKEQDNYTPMAFQGFEPDRQTLKYRCPAVAKGEPCTQRELCNGGCHSQYGRVVRVPLAQDRRVFTPQARDSKTWKSEYKHRSAVERVNGRLDLSFGFEHHFIRGQKKMQLRCGLALVVMLAMALGRIQSNQREHMRSLVRPAV